MGVAFEHLDPPSADMGCCSGVPAPQQQCMPKGCDSYAPMNYQVMITSEGDYQAGSKFGLFPRSRVENKKRPISKFHTDHSFKDDVDFMPAKS